MINKNSSNSAFKKMLPYIIAFAVSMIAGLLLYNAKEISPFGDQSVLCMDLWGQYFPMYFQNANADSFSELLYSWNGAFGYNNWAQNAYYCNSIFLLLMTFIPAKAMVSALNWFCLVKMALCAVTCLMLLKYKLKKHSPLLISGAVCYSLCTYMLAFLSQFMWTDLMMYAPLVILGLELLMHEKKPLLYFISLALSIISNFYVGFALCIFCALYFIFNAVLEFRITRGEDKKIKFTGGVSFGWSVLRFTLFSILAGAAAAAVILPVGFAIGNTLASEAASPEQVTWYLHWVKLLQELIPGGELALGYADSGVNIGTGILVFILVPVYFLNKEIRISERILNGVFLVFLFVSTNCNVLDFIWHGFHFPNQLPGRWTFMLSLMIIILGCSGLSKLSGITAVRAAIGVVFGIALTVFVSRGFKETEAFPLKGYDWFILIASGILIIIMAVVQTAIAKNKRTDGKASDKKASKYIRSLRTASLCMAFAVACMQVYSSVANFINVSQLKINGLQTSFGQSYTNSTLKLGSLASEWKSDASDFYRMEANPGTTFNPSMFGDYNGIDYYSSTMNGSVFTLLKYLGNRIYADKVSTIYDVASPVQNGLFGVKYFTDISRNLEKLTPYVTIADDNSDGKVWENTQALSLAYGVSENILGWKPDDEIRAIQNQNEFLNLLCGQEINAFEKLDCTTFSYENVELMESENWNENFCVIVEGQTTGKFSYSLTCPQDGAYYIEHNFRAGTITITSSTGAKQITAGSQPYIYLGSFAAGENICVDVTIENAGPCCCGLNFYRFNKESWDNAYNMLSQQQLDITSFKNTKVTGDITMNKAGLVMATIPQDGGWSVYCDGEKLETTLIGDTFVGVYVPDGTHTLEFRYNVPGLAPGLIISISAVLIALWIACPKMREKILKGLKSPKKGKNTAPEEESTPSS